jgi:hypothetical protein
VPKAAFHNRQKEKSAIVQICRLFDRMEVLMNDATVPIHFTLETILAVDELQRLSTL